MEKKINAPYKPKMKNPKDPFDLSYFDTEESDEEDPDRKTSKR